jgi:hypothetical protein
MTAAPDAGLVWKTFAAPVSVQSCRVEMAWESPMSRGTPGPLVSGVAIAFVNHASVTANRVVFAIRYNGRSATIRDDGTFSPGVPIQAQFDTFARTDYWRREPRVCRVSEVDFTDGTVWRPAAG